jgi:hypothetical protein
MAGYHVAAIGAAGRPTFQTRGVSGKSSASVSRSKKGQVTVVQLPLNLLLTLLKLWVVDSLRKRLAKGLAS